MKIFDSNMCNIAIWEAKQHLRKVQMSFICIRLISSIFLMKYSIFLGKWLIFLDSALHIGLINFYCKLQTKLYQCVTCTSESELVGLQSSSEVCHIVGNVEEVTGWGDGQQHRNWIVPVKTNKCLLWMRSDFIQFYLIVSFICEKHPCLVLFLNVKMCNVMVLMDVLFKDDYIYFIF